MKLIKKIAAMLLTLSVVFSFIIQPAKALTGEEMYDKFLMLMDILKTYHLSATDSSDPFKEYLIKTFEDDPESFNSLVTSIYQNYDDHSLYIPEGYYDSYFPGDQSYVGIGIALSEETPNIIESVTPESPASRAGVLAGDKIITISGQSTQAYTAEQIVALLRGEAGTMVSFTVSRKGASISFSIIRQIIGTPAFQGYEIEPGIEYMKITTFDSLNTYVAFKSEYDSMAQKDIKSLIIDLRGNPGGDVGLAFNMINAMIPDKDITYCGVSGKDGFFEAEVSSGIGIKLNKIVILVDKYSASASEIMSGSLKDLGYATLVGQTTYGKGTAQYHFGLGDGSYAVITAFEFIMPSAQSYNKMGITPDYVLENSTKPHPASLLGNLNATKELYMTNYSTYTTELKKRLCALSYLPEGKFYGSFDNDTLSALNKFQKDYGIPVTKHCNIATLNKINSVIATYKGKVIVDDLQYKKALSIAREAAKAPIQYYVDGDGIIHNN